MLDHQFRTENSPDSTVTISSCEVDIAMRPGGLTAEYKYSYSIVASTPLEEWFHDIPATNKPPKLLNVEDALGSLETSFQKDAGKTRLHIKPRASTAGVYQFSFSYSAPVVTLRFPGIFWQRVVYSDSFYHDSKCDQLRVNIVLPAKAVATMSNPAVTDVADGLVFTALRMNPLDDLTFLVAYRENRIGRPFWFWLGSTLISTLLGAFASWLTTP